MSIGGLKPCYASSGLWAISVFAYCNEFGRLIVQSLTIISTGAAKNTDSIWSSSYLILMFVVAMYNDDIIELSDRGKLESPLFCLLF
ncbi:hypothetical protein F8M41_014453 [Gigaspora margarita]|uniref:Uncharacterized protein n=1 Tax=Gigaspora margarita TaxID=4874 RepID=A0A8H4ARN6_GIGMA|nr:hypothetical protein F8M41_014453 [Gigaspora margarita]